MRFYVEPYMKRIVPLFLKQQEGSFGHNSLMSSNTNCKSNKSTTQNAISGADDQFTLILR